MKLLYICDKITNYNAECKKYIFEFEWYRKKIYIKWDYKNKVSILNNFCWRFIFLLFVDVNDSIIKSVKRLLKNV
jgi:hypothetical protein